MLKHLLPALFLCCTIPAMAQKKPVMDSIKADADTTEAPYSYFTASLDFVNNYVYVGRASSDIYPYLTPAVTYTHKSGFYVGGSLSFLTVKDSGQLDMGYLSLGYAKTFGNLETSIDINKYWYNSTSLNPKANVGSDITLNGAYDFGPVRASASVFTMFSAHTDWGSTLALDHSFYLLDEALEITPTLTMWAGTTKYLGKHYEKVFTPKRLNGNSYTVAVDLSDATRFKVLDFELSLPITYSLGKWSFYAIPVYAMPVNAANAVVTITKPNGQQVNKNFTEKLSNRFFFSLGVEYEF